MKAYVSVEVFNENKYLRFTIPDLNISVIFLIPKITEKILRIKNFDCKGYLTTDTLYTGVGVEEEYYDIYDTFESLEIQVSNLEKVTEVDIKAEGIKCCCQCSNVFILESFSNDCNTGIKAINCNNSDYKANYIVLQGKLTLVGTSMPMEMLKLVEEAIKYDRVHKYNN